MEKKETEKLIQKSVSKINFHKTENTVLFTPGAVEFNGRQYGIVVEVMLNTQQVVFEATITPPIAPFSIVYYIYNECLYILRSA